MGNVATCSTTAYRLCCIAYMVLLSCTIRCTLSYPLLGLEPVLYSSTLFPHQDFADCVPIPAAVPLADRHVPWHTLHVPPSFCIFWKYFDNYSLPVDPSIGAATGSVNCIQRSLATRLAYKYRYFVYFNYTGQAEPTGKQPVARLGR
ncbi:hypothetical protein BDZ91DRAFT_170708 [Kalaharituber pfeilii]|nr:hypothetical protein BDZ91DRAFT_170708 [Kalaharituber pfeilii]